MKLNHMYFLKLVFKKFVPCSKLRFFLFLGEKIMLFVCGQWLSGVHSFEGCHGPGNSTGKGPNLSTAQLTRVHLFLTEPGSWDAVYTGPGSRSTHSAHQFCSVTPPPQCHHFLSLAFPIHPPETQPLASHIWARMLSTPLCPEDVVSFPFTGQNPRAHCSLSLHLFFPFSRSSP